MPTVGSPSASSPFAPGRAIKGFLLDLDGVVHVRDALTPRAIEAIARIAAVGLPYRFITNTTRRPRRRIVADLQRIGLAATEDDVLTPAALVGAYLKANNLAPFLVIHPNLAEDFAGAPTGGRTAVVVGDAGEFFTYALMNQAFRKLVDGAELLALAKNRFFRDHDGGLSLDAGPFVAALEYAGQCEAQVFGKPARAFFEQAIASLGCAAEDVVMIGDDAEADVGGAMAAGLMGVLVRTGKYQAGCETGLAAPPTLVADNLSAAVETLLG